MHEVKVGSKFSAIPGFSIHIHRLANTKNSQIGVHSKQEKVTISDLSPLSHYSTHLPTLFTIISVVNSDIVDTRNPPCRHQA